MAEETLRKESGSFTQDEILLVAQVFENSKISPLQPNSARVCMMAQGIIQKMQATLQQADVAEQVAVATNGAGG